MHILSCILNIVIVCHCFCSCNLSSVVLQLLALGISDVLTFDFMDKPSKEVSFSPFLPLATVSLCRVAGQTFPSLPVNGPFLPDLPGFQVPTDSFLQSQLWSSSKALPLHFHFNNCSDVFGFISSFHVSKPF